MYKVLGLGKTLTRTANVRTEVERRPGEMTELGENPRIQLVTTHNIPSLQNLILHHQNFLGAGAHDGNPYPKYYNISTTRWDIQKPGLTKFLMADRQYTEHIPEE